MTRHTPAAAATAAAAMTSAPASPLPTGWAMWGVRPASSTSTSVASAASTQQEDAPQPQSAKRRRSPLAEMEGARRLHERRGGMALCPLDLLASAGVPRLSLKQNSSRRRGSSSSNASSGATSSAAEDSPAASATSSTSPFQYPEVRSRGEKRKRERKKARK